VTAPPGIEPTFSPDLAGNQEGGRESLRSEAQAFVAECGLRLSGSRQRKLIVEFERAGGDISRMSFRSWLQKRGDLMIVHAKPVAHDPGKHDWRVTS
jgi:hypothetical protein